MRTFAILVVLSLTLLAGCTSRPAPLPSPTPEPVPTATEPPAPTVTPEPTPEPTPAPTPEPTPEPTPAPPPGILRATLTIGGDIVMHLEPYQESKQPDGSYDFSAIFEDVEAYISETDYATCCFEGAFVDESRDYTGYPTFHVTDDLAYSLKKLGFDLVATASNHAMDDRFDGLVRTLDVLDAAGLDHVGTYRTQEERDANSGVLLKEINGIKIAFLDYTYGTNAIPIKGFEYALNVYYKDYLTSFNNLDRGIFERDMAYAKSLEPDLIAVIMHWGAEYISGEQPRQTEVANYLFSLGADLVLGGHPHVPQPMRMVEIENPDGSTRQGFVCFCLGNLLAHMHEYKHTNSTLEAMLHIVVEKDCETGETVVKNVEYRPMKVVDLADYGTGSPDRRFRIVDIKRAIADYEAGDDRGYINSWLYNDLVQNLKTTRSIMGTELEAE